MASDPATRTENNEERSARKGKKTYQKPSFRFEKVFETRALVCGKIAATQSSCVGHPQAS